ncbi:MAG: DUF6273 domain-containing protein [Oscillospiraceae bacterium]|jgi:hypothetical protein|nr:DUF6273 domain-containing protein [Oscillospiraceae bacterium]
MKKRVIAIILGIVMVITLVACNLFESGSSGDADSSPVPTGSADSSPTPTPEATPDPIIPNLPDIDELRTGDLIHFAGIFWQVLALEADRALIITEDVIERRAYHVDGGEITWEFSSIRNYLNNEFLNNFNLADQNRILETNVINSNNPEHGTLGGNDTEDKIFLLSIDEALTYFVDNSERIALNSNGVTNGWWLRSPSGGGNIVAGVLGDGRVGLGGYGVSNYYSGGVRPALWLSIQP